MRASQHYLFVNYRMHIQENVKFLILSGLLLLISTFGFGQNPIFNNIENAKSLGMDFGDREVFQVTGQQYAKSNVFVDPSSVPILKYVLDVTSVEEASLSFKLKIDGRNEIIDLLEVSDKFYDFEVATSSGEHYNVDRNSSKHFRGIIRGQPNSMVAMSFFRNEIMGIISNEDGNYNISKIEGSSNFILFNDSNLIPKTEFECGTVDDTFTEYDREILLRERTTRDLFETNCVSFYFETEYDIYQHFGNTSAVINYVSALYNQVGLVYQNEGIDTTISQVYVWTSPDPYTAGNTGGLLTQFQNHTGAFNGDLGQLLTFRSMGGQAAGFNGICNSNSDLSLSVSGSLTPGIVNFPVYSWNVMVVAHEFGHLFGSRHTHACVWNGNNTAIDGCAGYTEGGCSLPGAPPGGGTIMSYCHISPVGINFNNGFGLQPGNVIRDRVANGSCLGVCSPCPPSPISFDLYTKDRYYDNGNEPNPDSGPMWISEDIWIRQNLDGGTVEQNPEFKTYSPNGVYVKVRNRSNITTSCAVLKVYFSKASAGLQWPVHFDNYYQNVGSTSVLHGDIIGTATIPPIAPYGSITIELPWYPPNPANYSNDIHHFCLVSRIITPNDPMANEVTGGVNHNARENNNIAWKNVTVFDVDPSGITPPTSVFVRGINEKSHFTNIYFRDGGFNDKITDRFFKMGRLILDIEPALFERLLRNGSLNGPGIKIEKENRVYITSSEAVIKNFPLYYNETFSLHLSFEVDRPIKEDEHILVDLIQENVAGKYFDGGERFLITQSKHRNKAEIAKDDVASFEIIPNSNNGRFALKLHKVEQGTYTILDVYGRVILQDNFYSNKDIDVDISNKASNIYFVKITSGDLILTQIMIKN